MSTVEQLEYLSDRLAYLSDRFEDIELDDIVDLHYLTLDILAKEHPDFASFLEQRIN
jgi:hypothetical protein